MSINEETRGISKDVLEKLLGELNRDFIDNLPSDPSDIINFAKRRINPYIASSLGEDLAKRMLEYRLSDKDYLLTLFKSMSVTFDLGQEPQNNPLASILVAQTGAGKSNLRKMLILNGNGYVIIDSDLYKKYRPDAEFIRSMDATHFGALTGIDSYDHAENIRNYTMEKGYNILMEVAPSMEKGLIGVNFEKLQQYGYDSKIHIMAVGDLVSAIAVHYRYEKTMFFSDDVGNSKLTDLHRHDESYKAVEECIKNMDPSKINLYVRGDKEDSLPKQIDTTGKTIDEIIQILREERLKSNYRYATATGENSFAEDYANIKKLMYLRKAPQEEYMQLEKIHNRYLGYLKQINQAMIKTYSVLSLEDD